MLTKEIIKANAALNGLSDEQLAAIEELSRNDESAVIGQKLREVHDRYDADIKELTGREKPMNVKTYDHLKTVIAELKAQEGDKGEADKLRAQVDALQQLKDGKGDEALKARLQAMETAIADKESHIKRLEGRVNETKAEWEKKYQEAQGQNTALRINYEFEKALADPDIKFSTTIPKEVLATFLENAKSRVTSTYKADWIGDGNGGQKLVFRDESGEIIRNKENGLNPFTPGELLKKELAPVLDKGKQQAGAGTGANGSAGKGGEVLDVSAARTQVEATDAIAKHLMSKGFARGTAAFDAEMMKIREENKIADLPLR